jgi:phosphoenolpyruvate synthase/pyruvate phosphate dikinase
MIAEKWFEWEREATVHPILLCMEAWMQPTKTYCGRAWPSTYLHYKGDLVHWISHLDELEDYGCYLIVAYLKPEKRKGLDQDIERIARKLDRVIEMSERLNPAQLTERELLDHYLLVKNAFVEWFVPGALVEPVGLDGERQVRELLSRQGVAAKEIDAQLSLLTTTPRKSFSRRELEELLAIGISAQSGADVDSALRVHAQKYYWLHNNYFSTEVLGPEFFRSQLTLLSKNGEPAAYLEKIKSESRTLLQKKRQLVGSMRLTPEQHELIELLELFAWYQDYRKEYAMKLLHCLDAALAEIGRRKGLSLKHMKYSMALEVPGILYGAFDVSLLEKRMHGFLAVWRSDDDTFECFTEDAAEVWKRLDPHIRHNQEQLELSGSSASSGIARGRALVTMSASEASKISQGEILVTSMTTPDFVTAMKKAAAIVTNEGGILCHAAVLSREFRIPCVVGTRIATKTIKTGDLIEVDGDKGIVKKL